MLIGKMNPGNPEQDPAARGEGSEAPPAWATPLASGPISARVALPGSKSLTNRELILAALADGASTLHAPLHSRDSQLMIDGLRALGVEIEELENPAGPYGPDLRITPPEELSGSTSVACGLAGTVMRFMPAVAALALGPTAFDGDPYARHRPMKPVLEALRQLGADISDDGRGTLPFTVHGSGSLRGGRVEVDASLSSQFVSGLLLSAPRFEDGVHIVHTGERLPSAPHIDMTVECLRRRGVEAHSPAPGEWVVQAGPILALDLTIEPDLSNAAPFLAAAIAAGGEVTVPNWPSDTTQVGDQLRTLLPAFGASIELASDNAGANTLTIRSNGEIKGVDLHVPEAGELAPTLVGLAALAAHGTDSAEGASSTITGIGHIRHHETDRIAALVAEVNRLGGRAEELEDGIALYPAKLHGGVWQAYADHRMATTGAVLGLRVPDVEIDDIDTTAKTLPQFAELWSEMVTGTGSLRADERNGAAAPANGWIASAGILSGLGEGI